MAKRKRRVKPKVLRAWWSENYTKPGEKVTLNALTINAAFYMLNFKIYEFRRKSKAIKEINVPVYDPEVQAKWKVAYKPTETEYGNPEFRFKAKIGSSSKTSKTLYVPAELEIALTFDDGPAPQGSPKTERVLKVLKKYRAKATLFVEHSRILSDYGKGILKRMGKEGHEIGIHGVDLKHHHVKHQDTIDFKVKLGTMKRLIESIIGESPRFIRPPGGWGKWEKGIILSKNQLQRIYREFKLTRVNGWGAIVGDPGFWESIDAKIRAASKGNTQKLIVLAHDLRDYDVANLSEIIRKILEKAKEVKVQIKFVKVSEIIK